MTTTTTRIALRIGLSSDAAKSRPGLNYSVPLTLDAMISKRSRSPIYDCFPSSRYPTVIWGEYGCGSGNRAARRGAPVAPRPSSETCFGLELDAARARALLLNRARQLRLAALVAALENWWDQGDRVEYYRLISAGEEAVVAWAEQRYRSYEWSSEAKRFEWVTLPYRECPVFRELLAAAREVAADWAARKPRVAKAA